MNISSVGILLTLLLGCGGSTTNTTSSNINHDQTSDKTKDGYIQIEGRMEGFILSKDGHKGYFTDVDHDALKVMDMKNYKIIGSVKVDLPDKGELNHIAISNDGTKVYISTLMRNQEDKLGSFVVVDIKEPTDPKVLGSIMSGNLMRKVAVIPDGKHIVVLDHVDMYVFNIEDPSKPKRVGELLHNDSVDFIEDIVISKDGKRAYLLSNDFHIINMEDPTLPRIISTTSTNYHNEGIAISKDLKRAYISHSNDGISVVNIEHEGNPRVMTTQLTTGGSDKISISTDGTKIYAAHQGSDNREDFPDACIGWRISTRRGDILC